MSLPEECDDRSAIIRALLAKYLQEFRVPVGILEDALQLEYNFIRRTVTHRPAILA